MIGTRFWWHCKLYTSGKWIAAQLHVIALTGICTPVPKVTYPTLQSTELSPPPHYEGVHRDYFSSIGKYNVEAYGDVFNEQYDPTMYTWAYLGGTTYKYYIEWWVYERGGGGDGSIPPFDPVCL